MKNDENKRSPHGPNKGLSRRGFLRGAGLTTAGTMVLNNGLMAFESKDHLAKGQLYPASAVDVSMRINGRTYALKVQPRTTLADALRYELGLTGTKVVCDRGSCSACTVYLDNKPVNSCMTLVLDVGDQEVTTIEGIAKDGQLHPVQQAFIDHDASQCGYCTPGMVMSCVHLVENNRQPSLADVKHATRGNLCRCGTYPHVFKATLAAAAKMK